MPPPQKKAPSDLVQETETAQGRLRGDEQVAPAEHFAYASRDHEGDSFRGVGRSACLFQGGGGSPSCCRCAAGRAACRCLCACQRQKKSAAIPSPPITLGN